MIRFETISPSDGQGTPMLNNQNRPAKRPPGQARVSLSAGAPRATRVLAETARPPGEPLSISRLPDLHGRLLVALVAAWLAGMLLEHVAALPLWLLLLGVGACGALAASLRQAGLPKPIARWLTLGLLLLACAAFGAARLALSSPV